MNPPEPIVSFDGHYRFLSNFWPWVRRDGLWVTIAPPLKIIYEGMTYPSVEHAFQAAKSLHIPQRTRIRDAGTPSQAKRIGRMVELRPFWDDIRVGIMERLLREKFSDRELADKLIATAPRQLIEGNIWVDDFWGVCNGQGANHLGRLLMKIRDDFTKA